MMHFCDKSVSRAALRPINPAKKERFLKRLFYLFDFTAKNRGIRKAKERKKGKNDAKMRLGRQNAFVKKGFKGREKTGMRKGVAGRPRQSRKQGKAEGGGGPPPSQAQ